jgi:hypothetical protein
MGRPVECICDDCGHEGVVLLEDPSRSFWQVLCARDYLQRTTRLRPPVSAHAAGAHR